MTPLNIVEGLIAGGVTGFLSGLLGVGGGFILIPLLTLVGIPIHTAVGTCLAFIACASLAGLIQHVRQGSIDLLVSFIMTCPAAIAANLGAHFSRLIPPTWLYLAFGTLLLGVLAFYRTAPQTRVVATSEGKKTPARSWYVLPRQRLIADVPYQYHLHVMHAALSGLGAGLLTGFFGVGGGFLLVPLGVIVLKIPLRVMIGTALAVTILPAWVGTLSHWYAGHVDMHLWLSLVVTGIVGSQIGARYVVRFAPQRLKNLFLLLLLAGACLMFMKGLTAAAG